MKKKVLIIEDEKPILRGLKDNLTEEGFDVVGESTGKNGLTAAFREDIDLVLLDLMLPGMSGYDVCRTIRENEKYNKLPIIMLTAKGEEDDIVTGLESGGDDYITKPFSPKVLVARIKSVLRRGIKETDDSEKKNSEEETVCFDDLCIDKGRHEVRLGETKIELTLTEFGVLSLLTGRPGWVFSRQKIIDAVRGYDYSVTPRAIDVQVFGLRKKLGDAGTRIETVRGIGYRFMS